MLLLLLLLLLTGFNQGDPGWLPLCLVNDGP
jgi:hypothetical protein